MNILWLHFVCQFLHTSVEGCADHLGQTGDQVCHVIAGLAILILRWSNALSLVSIITTLPFLFLLSTESFAILSGDTEGKINVSDSICANIIEPIMT